ncbi:MAG: hypothetical protein RJQ09_08980 [Cyclobacteriaceae bacterium]
MDTILFILTITFLASCLFRVFRKTTPDLHLIFAIVLVVKVIAAIGLGLIYSSYYEGGDTWNFYKAGLRFNDRNETLAEYFGELSEPINYSTTHDPGNAFFARLTSIVVKLSLGNYWITAAFFATVSFITLWTLMMRLIKSGIDKWPILIAFFGFPSVVLWSSGLLKDTLMLICLASVAIAIIPLFSSKQKFNTIELAAGLLGLFIILKVKYYLFAVCAGLLICICTFEIFKSWLQRLSVLIRSFLGFGFVALLIIALSQMHYNLKLERVLSVIVENYEAYNHLDQGKKVDFDTLEPTIASFIWHSPKALFTGIFRPLIWEGWNVVSIWVSIENTILLAFFIYSLRGWRSYSINSATIGALAYSMILATLFALSTPNLGTLSRYKVSFLPIFIFVIMYAIYNSRKTGRNIHG